MSFTFGPSADSVWNDSPAMEHMQPSSSSSTLELEWRGPAAGTHSYVPLQQPHYPVAGLPPPVPSLHGENPQYHGNEMNIPPRYTNVYPVWRPNYQAMSEPTPSVEDASSVLSSFAPSFLDNDYDRYMFYLEKGVADARAKATSADGGEQGYSVPDWAYTANSPAFSPRPMLSEECESFADALENELEEASPPAHYAFQTGCVAPADLELVPSRPRDIVAAPPAPYITYSLPPSMPAPYALHNLPHHIPAPLYAPYDLFPHTPNVPVGFQYSPSPSTSVSCTPMPPNPFRHYRPAAFRDATPISRLASPDIVHFPMPPAAGPSKPYRVAGAEQSHAEGKAKREDKRQRRRHDPLAFEFERPSRPAPRAEAVPQCTLAGKITDLDELKTLIANAPLIKPKTFVCDWAGCGQLVATAEMLPHLQTVHGLAGGPQAKVQCAWGACTKGMLRSSLVKHLWSEVHLESKLLCTDCSAPFAREDALRRHLRPPPRRAGAA
ncbi:hypothetical protein FB451DRAFT_1371379 [Mycena latifolia]|nr:hypothetical protein FB451DRAFT_1371379 [Mycena latifolia]